MRKEAVVAKQQEKQKQQKHSKQHSIVASVQSLQHRFDEHVVELAKLREQNVALNAELVAMKVEGQRGTQNSVAQDSSAEKQIVVKKQSGAPLEGEGECSTLRQKKARIAPDNPSLTQDPNDVASPVRDVDGHKKRKTSQQLALANNVSQSHRSKLQIRVEEDPGGVCPAPVTSFEELTSLPQYVFDNLKRQGIQSPMPIQAQALPLILAKQDVIGLAQTGSGKTLAFLIPSAVHLTSQQALSFPKPNVLILAPTRELAVQISDESEKLFLKSGFYKAHPTGIKTVCVFGGGDKWTQQKRLKWGAHIVVATPGRLLDFANANAVCLSQVDYFVLDEADRMLDLGFHEDVNMIAGRVQQKRQVLFFSATWSDAVQTLALGLCSAGSKPVRISYGQSGSDTCGTAGETAKHKARNGIVQEVVVIDDTSSEDRWVCQERQKNEKLYDHLTQVLAASDEHKVLVFVSRKDLADRVSKQLIEKGFKADAMHGGKSQDYRLWVLDQFRQGAIRLLVCTDVLGRGIDIPSVSHVVIHEMGEIQDYIHRIGRTARGCYGKGHALVFFEYWEGLPHNAADLIDVLRASNQNVPKELQQIADEVAKGKRQVRNGRSNSWVGQARK